MRYMKIRHPAPEFLLISLACLIGGTTDRGTPSAHDDDRPRHFAVTRFA